MRLYQNINWQLSKQFKSFQAALGREVSDYKALALLLTRPAEASDECLYELQQRIRDYEDTPSIATVQLFMRVLIINVHMGLMRQHIASLVSAGSIHPPLSEEASFEAFVTACFPDFHPKTKTNVYQSTPSALNYAAFLLGREAFSLTSVWMRQEKDNILMEPAISGDPSFFSAPKRIKHVMIDYVLGKSSKKISTETMQFYVLCELQDPGSPLGRAFDQTKSRYHGVNSGSRAGVSEKIKYMEENSSQIIEEFLFRVQKEMGCVILPEILRFLNMSEGFEVQYENNDSFCAVMNIQENCLAEKNQRINRGLSI